MQTKFAVEYVWVSETAVSIEGSRTLIPALGAGSISVDPTGAVFDGVRREISRGRIIATGCASLGAAFFATAMFAGDRIVVPLVAIVAVLLFLAIALYMKRYRSTPFHYEVPWKDVVEFSEHGASGANWSVRLRGREAGTLHFSLSAESRGEFSELMSSFEETGWTKVAFSERAIPEARVVYSNRTL